MLSFIFQIHNINFFLYSLPPLFFSAMTCASPLAGGNILLNILHIYSIYCCQPRYFNWYHPTANYSPLLPGVWPGQRPTWSWRTWRPPQSMSTSSTSTSAFWKEIQARRKQARLLRWWQSLSRNDQSRVFLLLSTRLWRSQHNPPRNTFLRDNKIQ